MATAPAAPVKSRDIHNHHMDSTVWDHFTPRDGDIVIGTYAKSGTTWTQQIIGQMLRGPDPELKVSEVSPWFDLRVPPLDVKLGMLDAQPGRRFIKTHLPVDALRFFDNVKYVYVARDGRDVMWSMYNHHANANEQWYAMLNDTPGRVGPPIDPPPEDICVYFRDWLARDGYPFWSFWENIRSWWAIRNLPNVRVIHYADLKRDMAGEMRALADFLAIEVSPDAWPAIETYCSFEWMKANAAKATPLGGAVFKGGAETFINRGENGRWQDVLPEADSAAYEKRALAELGPECAQWLARR